MYSAHVHIHKSYFIFLKKNFLFFLFCFVFEVRGLWVLVYSAHVHIHKSYFIFKKKKVYFFYFFCFVLFLSQGFVGTCV